VRISSVFKVLLILTAFGWGCASGDDDDTGAAGFPANGLGGTGGVPMAGMAGSAAGTGGVAGTAPHAGTGGMAGSPMAGAGAGAGGVAGSTAGSGGMSGEGGMAGMAAGSGGMSGEGGMAGMEEAGMGGSGGDGDNSCCDDGDCLCHGPDPTALTSMAGPYDTMMYSIAGTGCVYYPTDAEPPFAAVAISDGFLGAGGCGSFQTGQWGPLYASWGIVAMIVETGSSDQPAQRARALADGIAAFKAENMDSSSPLSGKLSGRYGTSGFSMGGGGTTIAAADDDTLLSDVAIMPWGPTNSGVTVPTLVICGSSDGTAPCAQHGTPAYNGIADSVPKMRVQISSGHAGQPSSGMGKSGQYGLAFQKVFLENDQRWRPLLVAADSEATNIH
jgi:hypothetical protein